VDGFVAGVFLAEDETTPVKRASFGVMHPRLTLPLALAGVVLAGCTFPSSRHVVSRHQVGQLQRIEYGTVQQITPVVVEGERGQLGLYGGGLTGAAAAGGVGQGVGRDLARAGGAVAGAVVGQATEEALSRKDAMEMVIKLENGSTVVLTQVQPPVVAVGDRVGVATGAGGARILMP
jgi:outer membrane lipoprotein SlyB